MFKKSSALIYIILAVSLICMFPFFRNCANYMRLAYKFCYTNLLKAGSSAVDIPVTLSVEDLKQISYQQGAP